jgi:hypothetical protein
MSIQMRISPADTAPADLADETPVGSVRRWALTQLGKGQERLAVRLFFDLLGFAPDDVSTWLILGDCYLAGGDASGSAIFYEHAIALRPDNPNLRTRLKLAQSAPKVRLAGWLTEPGLPSGAEAVRDYLARLPNGRPPQTLIDLLEDIVQAPEPSQRVRARLDEVLAYLPMLIALSASQIEIDGHVQQAETLARLAQQALV